MKRYFVALLAAFAAVMTLLASHWAAEAWLYRRCFEALYQGKQGKPAAYPSLLAVAADFGLALTPLEYWTLRMADARAVLLVPAIFVLVLGALGVARFRRPSTTRTERS